MNGPDGNVYMVNGVGSRALVLEVEAVIMTIFRVSRTLL